jgi:hypothetical protein
MTPAQAIALLQTMPADEPVFVLRGSDRTAPACINRWLDLSAGRLGWDHDAIAAAEACALAMIDYPQRDMPE